MRKHEGAMGVGNHTLPDVPEKDHRVSLPPSQQEEELFVISQFFEKGDSMRVLDKKMRQTFVALMFGVMSLATSVHADKKAEPVNADAVIKALQQGGHVVYLRHSITSRDTEDQDPVDYTNPSTQRNITAEGREGMIALGKAVRQLGIHIDKVVSSPFCRAVETSWYAFGRGELNDDLAFALGTTEIEAKRLGTSLRQMMQVAPAPGTNNIFVSHSANLKEATSVWPKEEGIAVIFKPMPNGELTYVGEIPLREWPNLVEQYAQKKKGKDATAEKESTIKTVDRSVLCGPVAARPTSLSQQAKQ
jgi:phosphohistidine phosphatase SixA